MQIGRYIILINSFKNSGVSGSTHTASTSSYVDA